MKRWLMLGVGAPTLALAGAWVLTPQAALKDWGHGFIDQRAGAPAALQAIDDALDLRLVAVSLVQPEGLAELAAPLVKDWQARQDLRFHLGPTYDDGVRAVHLDFAQPKAETGRAQLSLQARPVRCPDPGTDRRCYHVPVTAFEPLQIHAALTLEAGRDGRIHANAELLTLLVKADALRGALRTAGLGGLLASLDGLTVAEGLEKVGHGPDLDVDHDGAAEGFAFEFNLQAEGQIRSERPPVVMPAKREIYVTARVGGEACAIDLVGAALEARLPELMEACLGEARLLEPYLYWANLDADGVVERSRSGGGLMDCVDATVSGFALPVKGQACSLDLVVATTPDRPWRWSSGRPAASRHKAGHR